MLVLALLLLSVAARADVVELTNGVKMEGIVAAQGAEGVTLEVADGGTVFLDSASVVSVTLAPAERARLREEWRRQKAQDEEARRSSESAKKEAPSAGPQAALTVVNNIVVNVMSLPPADARPVLFVPLRGRPDPSAPRDVFGLRPHQRFDFPILHDGGMIGVPSGR